MKTILRKLLVAILFFSAITSYGQNQTSKIDTKAKKILDELSVKTKQYKTIVSEFIILAENKVAKTKDVQKGKIWIKGAKYKLDIANQVIINDSKTIYTVLKESNVDKYGHYFDILGYTPEELINHLEKQFTEGMTWENYGEFHVDHKLPISSFNIKEIGDEEFMKCWSLDNLQPMWGEENIRKSNKVL